MTPDLHPNLETQRAAEVARIAVQCRDLALDLTLRNPLLKLPDAERSTRLIPLRKGDASIVARTLLSTERSLMLLGSDCPAHEAEQARRARALRAGHLRLQVDLTADKLGAKLGKLRKHNEELIEKRGVPCGYAISHVLHWQSIDGTQCESPLVLIPVDIRDELDASRLERRVVFAPGDRETTMNPVLCAYLRHHFSIEIPKLEEGPELTVEEIERWVRQLAPICKARHGWRIEDSAAIGLFDCGAISVDCDPANWGGSIGQSRTLSTVLLDSAKDESRSTSGEFLPRTLVLEADGSQLHTLDLAAQGRNLVIHGPPGSGKSQTIVNLIAQAMAAGKSVLFVAQKPEAAMVVLNRLKSVGLDPFCTSLMPVGSGSKSNLKHSVLEGLTKRLGVTRKATAEDLQRRARLDQAVRHLEEHVAALRYVLPQFGRTAREIVADLALLHERPLDRFTDREIVEPASPADFSAATVALQNLVALRQDIPPEAVSTVGGLGTTRTSSNPNLSAAEFKDLVERLGQQIEVATVAIGELKEIGVSAPVGSLAELADWAANQPDLSLADDARDMELAGRLHRHGGREAFERLAGAKQVLRGLLEAHPDARRRGQSLIVHDTSTWVDARKSIDGTALADVDVESTGPLGQSFTGAERLLKETLLSGAGTVSAEALADAPDYSAWRGRLVVIGQIEQGRIHADLLSASCTRGSPASSQVTDLIAAIRRADCARGAAGRRLAISRIPGIDELERLQAVLCPRAGVLGRAWAFVTSKEYRQSRAAFRSMMRLPIKRRDWDSELQGAIDLRRAEHALAKRAADLGFARDTEHVDALESAASWLSGIERSAQVAQISSETTWEIMRDRRDPALESTERQIGLLCVRFARDGQLLQSMSAVAGHGGFRLQKFVKALSASASAAQFAAKQATAWGIDGDMTFGAILALGVAASRAREIEVRCAADSDARELVGADFAGVDSALSRLEVVSSWHAAAMESARPDWKRTVSAILTERSTAPERMARLKDRAAVIARASQSACRLCEQIGASFEMRAESARLRLAPDQSPRALAHFVRAILEHQASIPKVFRHHASASAARPMVGSALIDRYLDGSVDCLRITESFQAAAYEHSLRQHGELAPLVDFDRARLERSLAELRDCDGELRHSNAAVLRGRLASAKAPPGVDVVRVRDKTELSLIRHVIQTPNARLDLTGLYRRAGAAIRVLQPCTIATPTTVSEYLPRKVAAFDLVIIDEASQVEPASAIGSIARGAQVIIVGDPKQLPPTNFFGGAKGVPDDGDSPDPDGIGDGVADTESILDRAISSLTNVHLRGHYRSKHHSLIEYSNRQFYDSRLVVPPSTGPRTSKLGVVAHQVDGAFYSASENEVEAKAVAEAVLQHLRNSPDESIGVVAFNVRQADLIDRHIMALARRSREDFEAYARACGADTPLFVRSLESVQGDERDVIFISYTYGRDPVAKVVYQRFGPLTQQGGGRRLNVLVTRARKRVEVFHSLTPDEITAETGGVPLMRAYLHHAMRAPQHDFSEGVFESGFEAQVAAMIIQINPSLAVRPQVGCEGFRIDLGIALQSSPHRFILGVECDGATYHSEPSARQRDMIRQTILEQHGWTIHRIWSTAWWHNFAEERARLAKAIERAVAGSERARLGRS